jgi:hypothetical protein
MPLPKTVKEAKVVGAKDEAKKRELEKPFIADLNKIFRQIARDFKEKYIADRTILNVQEYSTDFLTILRNNYRKISKKFSSSLRDLLKNDKGFDDYSLKQDNESEQDNEDVIISLLLLSQLNSQIRNKNNDYILSHSREQSVFITNTTQNDLNTELENTLFQGSIVDEELSPEEIAAITSSAFLIRSLNRSQTIATTEVQNIAETSKNNESDILSDVIIAGVLLSQLVGRMWVTAGDERVRASHAFAEGQIVGIHEPFIVQGQLLMYPGDTSLGATLDNVINCRCSVVNTLK